MVRTQRPLERHDIESRFASACCATLALPPSGIAKHVRRDTSLRSGRPRMTTFFGRASELREVHELFEGGERLITLAGPAGIGKTRLSQRYVDLYGSEYKGDEGSGVWFCDLSEARTLEDLRRVVSHVLHLLLQDGVASAVAIEHLGRALAGRGRILVILDNCEQIVGPVADAVAVWLRVAVAVRFLLTSRELLGLATERVYELAPLTLPSLDVGLAKRWPPRRSSCSSIARSGFDETSGSPPRMRGMSRRLSVVSTGCLSPSSSRPHSPQCSARVESSSVFPRNAISSAAGLVIEAHGNRLCEEPSFGPGSCCVPTSKRLSGSAASSAAASLWKQRRPSSMRVPSTKHRLLQR